MATTARSGSTWRTGRSRCAPGAPARRRPHWATPRARPLSRRASLMRHQAISGSAGSRWRSRSLVALVERPLQAAALVELGAQRRPQVVEVGDVGGRVGEGVVAERAAQPVGQAVGLGQVDAEPPLQQHAEAGRAQADEPGGDLGVDQVAGHDAARPLEDLEVLAGGVHDAHRVAVEQPPQRPDVDRQRVDQDDVVVRRRAAAGPGGRSRCARGGTRCRARTPRRSTPPRRRRRSRAGSSTQRKPGGPDGGVTAPSPSRPVARRRPTRWCRRPR